MAILIKPSVKYKDSFIEALKEGFVSGDRSKASSDEIIEITNNFSGYLKNDADNNGTIVCEDGKTYNKVPCSTYWLIIDDVFIGSVSLRHRLNDFLIEYGGHIGYGVRPEFRKHGYGTLMLRLCLDKARKLKMDRVLITCRESNIGSAKIIQANGGILENVASYEWTKEQNKRFWITL